MASLDEVGWMFNAQPELSEVALRALGLKGDLPLQLVNPLLGLDLTVDDWTLPEYRWLRRTNLVTYTLGAGAGVGFPSTVQLFPPTGAFPGARPLVVIEKIIITNLNAAAVTYQIYFAAAVGTGVTFASGAVARDDRAIPNAAAIAFPTGMGMCLSGAGNTAAAPTAPGAGALLVSVPPGTTVQLDVPYVLNGRFHFTIATQSNNVSINAYAVARERIAKQTEQP